MTTPNPVLSALPKTLIGVSTKMYFDFPATTSYLNSLLSLPPLPTSTLLFLIPSFPTLPAVSQTLYSSPPSTSSRSPTRATSIPRTSILLGAQDCSPHDFGPHTGETSPLLLSQLGISIVEIGHAERRAPPHNESDALVAEKCVAVVRNRMVPLICIGETLPPKSGIMSESVGSAVRECSKQVAAVLDGLVEAGMGNEVGVVFAYEPVWAIGGDKAAEGDFVRAVVGGLREGVKGRGWRGKVRWLYGGSAGPGTWREMGGGEEKGGVDGLFLGRFAHDVANLTRVVEEVRKGEEGA
ncbi:MAG: hypothetical protein Q9190_007421 [Brigantiaea leucoxantha]